MVKVSEKINDLMIKSFFKAKRQLQKDNGWGLPELLAVIGGVIIVGLIVIPQFKTFAGTVLTKLTTWWDSVDDTIFSTKAS